MGENDDYLVSQDFDCFGEGQSFDPLVFCILQCEPPAQSDLQSKKAKIPNVKNHMSCESSNKICHKTLGNIPPELY